MVAQHRGQPGAARAAFEHGLAVLADAHWPLLLAELRLRLGQALAGSDPPAAIAEARAAHLIWERLGSPESARSAALLNQLGLQATSTPRAIDATAALSPREQEVLQRLRTGSSNAEIAADLHNSVRTIEHHVSAILAKLGLRSRAEAAVYAASIGNSAAAEGRGITRRYPADPHTAAGASAPPAHCPHPARRRPTTFSAPPHRPAGQRRRPRTSPQSSAI